MVSLSQNLLLFSTLHLIFLLPCMLYAACNQSNDPRVFKIQGTKQHLYIIEGECFREFIEAIGNGQDIDIAYAEIKGDIDFTNTEFFHLTPFYEAGVFLNKNDIHHFNAIHKSPVFTYLITFIKSKITIRYSVISDGIRTQNDVTQTVCLFKKPVNFSNTVFNSTTNFNCARFGSKVDFRNARFLSVAYFLNSRFECDADFNGAKFFKDCFFH